MEDKIKKQMETALEILIKHYKNIQVDSKGNPAHLREDILPAMEEYAIQFKGNNLFERERVVELIRSAISDIGYGIKIHTYPDGTVQSIDASDWIEKNVK